MNDHHPTLGFLLHEVARLLRKRFEQRARSLGFTRAQWQAIAYLSKNEGIHQAGLAELLEIELEVRKMFDAESATPAEGLLRAGELTQGLCSPWQHDYRECACYYWPASRPDYVNVEPTPDGLSRGDMWLAKGDPRPGEYILDDRIDERLVTYDELFENWEKWLRFQVKGRDAEQS